MRTQTSRGVVAVILLLAAASFAAQKKDSPARPGEYEYPSITNFLRINPQYCTGGQPTAEDLARMKKGGVRAIINLRRPSEYDAAAEEAEAAKLGLRYINIPVAGSAPTDAAADQFLKALADPQNRPAFIHCHTANRVGAFWMIRRVLVDGWTLDRAEQEARTIGLRSESLAEFARDYIRRHPRKPV